MEKKQEKKIVKDYKEGLAKYKVCKKYNISDRKAKKILAKNNVKIRGLKNNGAYQQYNVNENFFEKIDNESKAYWLGFLSADGYITGPKVGLTLSRKDIDQLKRYKKAINYKGEIKNYTATTGYNKGKKYSRIIFTNRKMVKDLIDKGLVYNKTLKYKMKKNKIPKKLKKHFFRGYFDGDGSLNCIESKNKKRLNHNITKVSKLRVNGTPEFLKVFSVFLLGKEKKLYKKKNQKIHRLEIGGNRQVIKCCKKLYKNANVFMPRKKEIFHEIQSIYSNE